MTANSAMTTTTATVGVVLEKATDGLSLSQAAKKLGVSRQTIFNWIKAGKLPATVFGDTIYRIDPADLEKLRKPA